MRDENNFGGKLASIAYKLIETAAQITESIERGHQMRKDLLRKTRAKQRCARQEVRTEVLGMAGRGYREHIEHDMTRLLVNEAIKDIDFEVEPLPINYSSFCITRFTAKAYILTQAELTALVDDAIEIGRRS